MLNVCKFCYDRIRFGRISSDCVICCNAFERVRDFAKEIVKSLSEYEFERFQVGSRVRGSLKAIQEYLLEIGINDEKNLKSQFNKMLSNEISRLTGKRHLNEPEVVITFDLEDFSFDIKILPVYIYGRYLKRIRNISQTRWLCRYCNGKGCEICNYTGKKYYTSVEELIAKPVIEMFKARDAILHGAGREDVDARMLGNGRPFVLEIVEPKKRYIPIEEIEKAINEYCKGKVEVRELRYAKAKDVKIVKTERRKKIYRVKVIFEREVSEEEIKKAIEELSFREIHQRTPKRVLHRRADLLRIRRTYDIDLILHRGKIAVLKIVADGGLYIKELISGDDGRTKPNLSELIGCSARVEKLDVLDVI